MAMLVRTEGRDNPQGGEFANGEADAETAVVTRPERVRERRVPSLLSGGWDEVRDDFQSMTKPGQPVIGDGALR